MLVLLTRSAFCLEKNKTVPGTLRPFAKAQVCWSFELSDSFCVCLWDLVCKSSSSIFQAGRFMPALGKKKKKKSSSTRHDTEEERYPMALSSILMALYASRNSRVTPHHCQSPHDSRHCFCGNLPFPLFCRRLIERPHTQKLHCCHLPDTLRMWMDMEKIIFHHLCAWGI